MMITKSPVWSTVFCFSKELDSFHIFGSVIFLSNCVLLFLLLHIRHPLILVRTAEIRSQTMYEYGKIPKFNMSLI